MSILCLVSWALGAYLKAASPAQREHDTARRPFFLDTNPTITSVSYRSTGTPSQNGILSIYLMSDKNLSALPDSSHRRYYTQFYNNGLTGSSQGTEPELR
jgi:hypothetical protein